MLAIRRRKIHCEFDVDAKRSVLRIMSSIETIECNFLEKVSNSELQKCAEEFLKREDLYQIVRREILFGLVPKTFKRKSQFLKNNNSKLCLSW